MSVGRIIMHGIIWRRGARLLGIWLAVWLGLLCARGAELGVGLDVAGGPLVVVVAGLDVNERWAMEGSVGGFPGIILRAEWNVRRVLARRRPSYVEGGVGCLWFFRGRGDGESIRDLHVNVGIARPWRGGFEVRADIGLLWVPVSVNPWIEKEFPDVAVPVVPAIGVKIVRGI